MGLGVGLLPCASNGFRALLAGHGDVESFRSSCLLNLLPSHQKTLAISWIKEPKFSYHNKETYIHGIPILW